VAGKLNLSVMSAAFLIFGLSLAFQAHRWESTPAYHVLLQIFSAQVWGVMFVLSGTAMGLAAWKFERWRWLVIAALTVAFTLTTGWMLAFVARYASSPNTTPETWVSWAVFDFLLVKVAISLDRPPATAGELAEQAIIEARSALQLAEEAYARAAGQPAKNLDRD
jgi:hypothetical protein